MMTMCYPLGHDRIKPRSKMKVAFTRLRSIRADNAFTVDKAD